MTETTADKAEPTPETAPAVPVTFRLTIKWKRARTEAGPTSLGTYNLAASEALDAVLGQLPGDAVTVESNGPGNDVTTIRVDWAKVPAEIRYPHQHGARR